MSCKTKIGQIVHFIPGEWGHARQPERHIPAIITRVSWCDDGVVNLRLFADLVNDFLCWERFQWPVSVPYDETATEPFSWHYPED